ncbi:sigma-70 family RNA polymerase sigma factor [bacterium]|nr:sigma-70 family RNA polymerase sigma factor [bacterium]
MTDDVLIERFLEGDIHAFNLLVWRWERPIFNFVYRNLGNEETAQDVCQHVFLRVYKKLKTLRERQKFSSWIYRIALNLCRDEYKKRKNHRLISIESDPEDPPSYSCQQIMDASVQTPEDLCHQQSVSELLKEALMKLPEEQRTVIIMKQYQGLKFIEIADILKQPVNTVKSRLYNGLQSLRIFLEKSKVNKEVLLHEM